MDKIKQAHKTYKIDDGSRYIDTPYVIDTSKITSTNKKPKMVE
jgi:hypothetical protein